MPQDWQEILSPLYYPAGQAEHEVPNGEMKFCAQA